MDTNLIPCTSLNRAFSSSFNPRDASGNTTSNSSSPASRKSARLVLVADLEVVVVVVVVAGRGGGTLYRLLPKPPAKLLPVIGLFWGVGEKEGGRKGGK